MRKIEQWLIKNSSRQALQSPVSVSRYYYLKHLKIRFSDHLKPDLKSDADIQIIYPTSSECDYYTVIYNNSHRLMVLNAKQIIDMLPTLVKLNELSIVEKPIANVKDKNIKQVKEQITLTYPPLLIVPQKDNRKYDTIIYKRKLVWNQSEIEMLQSMLNSKYKHCKGFNGTFQDFLKTYPCTLKEALTLYWVICINAKLTPTDDLLLEAMDYIEKNYKET